MEAPLNYNPHTVRHGELTRALSSAEHDLHQLQQDSDWYQRFNPEAGALQAAALQREIVSIRAELQRLDGVRRQMGPILDELVRCTRLGFDPRNWFSAQRRAALAQLKAMKREFDEFSARSDTAAEQLADRRHALAHGEDALARHRAFDPQRALRSIADAQAACVRLRCELEEVTRRMHEADEQLREPLHELSRYLARQRELQRGLEQAQQLDRQISQARSGYDRRTLHAQCERLLGNSRPSQVVRERQRELDSVQRSIAKLNERLLVIRERVSKTIAALVIDGNNLCYRQQTFLGLAPVQALAAVLVPRYRVTVVFDGSIRRLLGESDRAIAAQFNPVVTVHIVANNAKADETVLDAAVDAHTFVVSNDRFVDFPGKPAVKGKRLIGHEILNGMVLVHELNVAERFHARPASAR